MTTAVTPDQNEGWTADASTFGARLALIRQRMGWGNVERAARECGLPVETWRSWERDNRIPNRLVTIAMAIATRTGCDYLWLVHGPDRGKVAAGRLTTQYPVPRIQDLAPHIRTYPIGPLPEVTFGDGRKGPRQIRRQPVALSA